MARSKHSPGVAGATIGSGESEFRAEHHLEQVRLLVLGRHAGRRTGALDVDDDERQLDHDRQAHRLGLERDARAGRGGQRQRPAIRRADGGADRGDLVLGLERLDPERLVARQLVEDVRGRGDRVRAVEQLPIGQPRRGQEAERRRLVAGDVPIDARVELRRPDAVVGVERLGRLAERVAGLERALVRLGDDRSRPELAVDPVDRRVHAPLVQPEHEAEREEVLGQVLLLAGHVEPVERALVERRDRHLEDRVRLERAVRQRVAGVGRLVQVLLGEGVLVDDERAARRQVADVRLERRRVHRDEDVGLVAGRVDVRRREADLEAGHAGQRAGRCADLGREVGQRADVVAEDRRGPGELRPRQLHPVARIAGEPDGDPLEFLDVRPELFRCDCHAPSGSFMRWCGRGGRLRSSSGNDSARYLMMSAWRTTPTR